MSDPIPNQSKVHAGDYAAPADDEINPIRESLRGLRYGSVNIIVQDGVIIQIDRTEKRRLRNSKARQ